MPATEAEPDVGELITKIHDAIHGERPSLIDTAEFCRLWKVSRTTFYNRRDLVFRVPQAWLERVTATTTEGM